MQLLSGRKRFYLICFALHFALIAAVCIRDTFWLVGKSQTVLPDSAKPMWNEAGNAVSGILGTSLPRSHIMRRVVTAYTEVSGIEAGYAFFAPNLPDAYKLVFELRYPNGAVEYDLPRASNAGGGLGTGALLDNIGTTQYGPLRERLIEMLAYSAWRRHPKAKTIRAVLGCVHLPTVAQFRQGAIESYEYLYAYEFHVEDRSARSPTFVPLWSGHDR